MSQSLGRALDVLDLVASGVDTLDPLAEAVGVHKTTVLRLLQMLESRGYVARDRAHRYRLGPAVYTLAQHAPGPADVRSAATAPMRELGERTGQTIHLAAALDDTVTYIDKVESRQPLRMYSRIGLPAALHATAVAKVLLGDLDDEELARRVADIEYTPFTGRTIRGPEELVAEVRRSAARGWAEDHEEHETFMNCIAAPVRAADGRVVAAVSISVPNVMLPYEGVLDLLPLLRDTVATISAELGFRGEQAFTLPDAPTKGTP